MGYNGTCGELVWDLSFVRSQHFGIWISASEENSETWLLRAEFGMGLYQAYDRARKANTATDLQWAQHGQEGLGYDYTAKKLLVNVN